MEIPGQFSTEIDTLHIITKNNVDRDINADGIYEPKVDYRAAYAKIWGR